MIKQRLKIAFVLFFVLVVSTAIGGIAYLQSGRFADSVKRLISKRSPENIGVIGNFSNLKLYLFPPAIGIANPKIHVEKDNISKLPLEGDIEAQEMRVSFAPIQMLSGTLEVDEITVVGGSVQGFVGAGSFKAEKKQKAATKKLQWQDLFHLQINGLHFEDTYLNVVIELPEVEHPVVKTELVVKNLEIKKEKQNNKTVFVSKALVNAVKFDVPKKVMDLPISSATTLQWNFELNDEGVNLAPFEITLPGLVLSLKGTLTGNVLESENDLKLKASALLKAELEPFFTSNFNDDQWGGEAQVSAKFDARLQDIVHSLKGSFSVKGSNITWKNMHASKVEGEGNLDLKAEEIELNKLMLFDQSGAGMAGEVKIENTILPLRFDEPFHAKVTLKEADLHWLGGMVLDSVYPLEGLVSGQVGAKFTPAHGKNTSPWELSSEVDLSVARFGLTNQSIKKIKPKHYVLQPSLPVQLKGGFEVSSAGLSFKKMNVKLQKTDLEVLGKVSTETGYELSAKGDVDLSEIKEIAENKVFGVGSLAASVHGPTSDVVLDFDVHLKDAEYLNLKLGDLSGRVTYEDGQEDLKFTKLKGHQRNTEYALDQGYLELDGTDELRLPFVIHSGRVEDLSYLLESLTHKISWFPQELKGEVHGKVELSGKMDLPHLEIASSIEGSDWVWLGERARKLSMDLGYDQGTYFVHDVQLMKTSGSIKGDLDFNSLTQELSWDFLTENLSLADIDFFDRLGIPAKSRIEIQSSGQGTLNHLHSQSEGKIFNTEIKGEKYEPTDFSLEVGESTLRASLSIFGDQLKSQFKYAFIPKQPSSFNIDFNRFDFSPIILMVNPKLLDDPELYAEIDGKFHLDFLSTQAELTRGQIQLKSYELKKTGFELTLMDPVEVPIQLGYFILNPTRFHFKNADLVLNGEGKRGDLDLHLLGTVDLALAELFSPSIQKVQGVADAEVSIQGPLKNLKVNGDIDFSEAKALLRFMQTPFEEIDGVIRIRQDQILVESIEANLGEEPFSLSGKIETYKDRFPLLDFKMQFDDNKIKMLPLEMAQVRGGMTLKGDQPPYILGGSIDLLQALWTKSFSQSSGTVARGDRFAPIDSEKQAGNSLFNLDLNVNANQSFMIKNDIMDGEFKGKIKLVGAAETPNLLGEGQSVQGKIIFRERPFVLESVKVTFDDPFQLNPKFNATAVADINQYKIKVIAYGKASQYKAEFSSTPFLSTSDIYSLLTSGQTASEGSRYKNKDRSFVNQGEAASLILHSLDFSKDVQSKTGLQFEVEEAVDDLDATSVFKPQTLGENVAAPKLVLKRSLGQNFGVSIGSTVGVGNEVQREVNAEYKLSKGVSVLGVWNNIEENTTNTRDTRTSFGLDVKLNQKFK